MKAVGLLCRMSLVNRFFLPDRVQRPVYFEHNDQWKHHINLFICNNL